MTSCLEADLKEQLSLFLDNYLEGSKECKTSIEIDTLKLEMIDQYTNYLIDIITEFNENEKGNYINEVLEKLDDLKNDVENI